MAPSTADSARSTRAKSATPAPVVPRIVPAIPLPFARAVKPKKPVTPPVASPPDARSEKENAPRTSTADTAVKDPEPAPTAAQLALTTEGEASPQETKDNPEQAAPGEAQVEAPLATAEAANAEASQIDRESATAERQTFQEQAHEPDQVVSREQPKPQPVSNTTRPQRPPFELPPPFYPSTDRSTPTSTTSSTFTRQQPPANHVVVHNSRPSANSIVFGGYPDSSSVSPAPPVTNGNIPYPPPSSGYAGAVVPPPYPFPGHAHHFSEPHAAMMYPAMAVPPQGNFGFRRDQSLPPHMRQGHSTPSPGATNVVFSPIYPANGYFPQRVGAPEPFSPHHGPTYMNGVHSLSRSGSQASSPRIPVTDETPADAVLDDAGRKRFVASMQNGAAQRKAPAPFFQPPPQAGSEFGLRDYMRAQFGSREFADYVLKLYQGDSRNVILCLPVHGLIMGRNRKLAELMVSSHPGHYEGGLRVLNLLVEDRFFDGPIFAEALKFLYSEDMLSPRNFLHGLPPFTGTLTDTEDYGSPAQRISHALAYAAAGFWLEIRALVSRGLEIAAELLRWDTVETALSFAIDGGLDASWRVEDASEDSSSDDASSKFDTDSAPSYGPYSTQFLQTINGFLVHNFPNDFELDTSVSQLYDIQRLPSVDEPRPTSRNPRLSQIRFGEVPVDPADPSRFVVRLLSSILVSLPFPVLKALLEDFVLPNRLGKDKVAQITQSVVEEREYRRRKALKHLGPHLEKDDGLKQNLVWVERVEPQPQHASGFRLIRSRQGIDTPASTLSDKSPERVH